MARRRVRIPELETAIAEILEEYGDDVAEGLRQAVLSVADIAKQEVKAEAPYRTGKYRRGWRVRKDTVDRFRTDAIIHNRTRYQIAHLLEKGHAKRGGGRVEAIVHIAPAEQRAVKNLEEAVKRIAQDG